MSEGKSLGIWMSPKIWGELMYITRKASPDEVSGVAEIEIVEDMMFVTEIHLIKQACSSGSTVFDPPEFAKFLSGHKHPERLKLWWHTHGGGGVFWSPTDTGTIRTLRGIADWLVSLVLNSNGEYLSRLDMATPVGLPPIKLVVKMDEKLSFEVKEKWDKEIQEKMFSDEFLPQGGDEGQLALVDRNPLFVGKYAWRSSICGDCVYFDRISDDGCRVRLTSQTRFRESPACRLFEPFELTVEEEEEKRMSKGEVEEQLLEEEIPVEDESVEDMRCKTCEDCKFYREGDDYVHCVAHPDELLTNILETCPDFKSKGVWRNVEGELEEKRMAKVAQLTEKLKNMEPIDEHAERDKVVESAEAMKKARAEEKRAWSSRKEK